MVVDNIENAATYEKLHPQFKMVFDFLRKGMTEDLEAKRYEIDGDKAYAMAQSYTTVPEDKQKWEAHRKYIDIQFITDGVELIGYSKLENMTDPTDYNPEKDCLLSAKAKDATYVRADKGTFVILWPQDAHQPKCMDKKEGQVKKIVAKVAVN